MAPSASTFLGLSVIASSALLATAQEPLASKHFTYPDGIPYKVDTDHGTRGGQYGYNLCNSTTEGPESLCQTAFINSVDDFCLWGPPEPNSVVGNTEGEMVAWCTKPGRGTRLIPEGALKGVQFVKAPSYVQVVGYIDQSAINIQHGDYGGEMDPHGADRRGNPLGGLVFSNAFGANAGSQWTQATEWHNFMGADMFCLKACDPADPDDHHYCEHILDRIGCYYNAPADYDALEGKFESCLSDNQRFPGVYVNGAGQTVTYQQPGGEIQQMPYQPSVPGSSQCTTYTSSLLYSELAGAAPASTSSSATSSGATSPAGASGSAAAASGSRGAGANNAAAGAAAAAPTASSAFGAASRGASFTGGVVGLAGLFAFAMLVV